MGEIFWLAAELTRFAEGFGVLVFKAHRLLYHSTLGLRVIKKKKKLSADLEGDGDKEGHGPLCKHLTSNH